MKQNLWLLIRVKINDWSENRYKKDILIIKIYTSKSLLKKLLDDNLAGSLITAKSSEYKAAFTSSSTTKIIWFDKILTIH